MADLQHLLLHLSVSNESPSEMGVRGLFLRYAKEVSDDAKSSRASMYAEASVSRALLHRRGGTPAEGDAEPLMRLDEWLQFCREEQGETNEAQATALFYDAATPPLRGEFEYHSLAARKKHLLGNALAKMSSRFSSMSSIRRNASFQYPVPPSPAISLAGEESRMLDTVATANVTLLIPGVSVVHRSGGSALALARLTPGPLVCGALPTLDAGVEYNPHLS
jgi:hypothetical protein